MRVVAPLRSRFFPSAILTVSCLILAGCSTPAARRSQRDSDVAQIPGLSKPDLLYLLPSPHSRIYVEVDAVEGCVPKEAALQKLRDFLSANCNKPDGIEIVRSDVIPIKAARGISPRALARKYINGPVETNASPPAFMYVLFYRYSLCLDSAVASAGHRGANTNTSPDWRPKPRNPYAEVLPYPAIYFNTRYFLGMALNQTLVHETGHLLGIASWPTHARDGHCLDSACLMNGRLRPYLWLVGKRQTRLCPRCLAELAEAPQRPPPSNVRFVGPVYVRSERNYQVLSLPDRLGVVFGHLAEQDCQNFAANIRAETPDAERRARVDCLIKDDVLKEPLKVSEMFNRLKDDPLDPVRVVGPKVFLRVCARRYHALGRYANATDTLHQAILLDSQDAGSYNQLAWIKATCSDASIRNGKEAVSAATKACELTEWKNWGFIDTLAAAYGEAGDFKRAIEFQQQALRTGNPSQSEQKQMRERLSLYEVSKPFRDKPNKS